MCRNSLAEAKFRELDRYIEDVKDVEGSLIAVLHRGQQLFGYLPREVQLHIARQLRLTAAKVNGVVTFYSYFSETPKGEHVVSVCLGTACFVRGAEKIQKELESLLGIKVGQTTADGKFSLDCLRCVGACGLAPVVMVDDRVFGGVTEAQVPKIIRAYREREEGEKDEKDKIAG